jgi:hypothetical protein
MESSDCETLNEWPQGNEKAPRKAFSLASGMLSFYFGQQNSEAETTSVAVGEVEAQLLPGFSEPQFETVGRPRDVYL